MKTSFGCLIIFLGFYTGYAQITFQKIISVEGSSEKKSVKQTSDGGYIVVSSAYNSGTGIDIFIIKTDAYGYTLWTKAYGASSNDYANSIEQTTDGGYIVAGYTSSFGVDFTDVYLLKIDSIGNILWSKTYGDTLTDRGYSVQQTIDGGYIVIGRTLISGPGNYDIYLIKTDSLGDTLWTKKYGGIGNDNASSVRQTIDGGYIIAGETWSFGAGSRDIYLIKADSIGSIVWARTYGGTGDDFASSIQQTADSGYIVTGYTGSFGAGAGDVYLIKTDSNGDTIWTKTYGGNSWEEGYSVQQTSDQGFIISGHTNSFGLWGGAYLIKTDISGNMSWTKQYSGYFADLATSIHQTSDTGYIVIANWMNPGGNYENYLIKTDENGNSGCNEINPGTVIGNTSTLVSSTSTLSSSGATVTNPVTIVNNIITIDTILCSSFCSLPASITGTDIICTGDSNGAADLTVTGGTPPFSYSWSNGDTTQDISGVSTGIYTVSVIDSSGCVVTESIIINEPPVLTTSIIISNITCNGYNDGIATLIPSGGTLPYSFFWSDSSNTDSIGGLIAGTYTVTVTDSNGCIATDSITITQPDSITIISVIDTAIQGINDGAINITVSGGSPPYTFSWDNGATSEDLDSIAAGSYTVTVTDSLGCIDSASILVPEITSIQQSLLVKTELKVYPNPNDGKFLLKYSIPDKQSVEFIIFDVIGSKLKTYQLEGGMKERNIANKALKNGLYFYKVIVNNRVILTDKLVIIK